MANLTNKDLEISITYCQKPNFKELVEIALERQRSTVNTPHSRGRQIVIASVMNRDSSWIVSILLQKEAACASLVARGLCCDKRL